MRHNKALMLASFVMLTAALLGAALALPGCGKKSKVSESVTSQPSTTPSNAATTPSNQQGTTTAKTQATQPSSGADVTAATDAAMASARTNNPALGELSVLTVKIVGDWARVDMQPVDKSTGPASWFLKKTGGKWLVVDFGTSVIPSDHPDAPAQLFK